MSGAVRIQVLSVPIGVSSDSDRTIDDLSKPFRYLDLRDLAPEDEVCTNYFAETRATPDRHSLYRNDERILQTHSYPYLLAFLEVEIYEEVARRTEDHLLVHAGAVGREDTALIFAGDKGAGKTTLVAALVKQGFEYYTDETAALDLGTSRLDPLPRSLNIKEKGRKLLQPFDDRLEVNHYGSDPGEYTGRYTLPRPDLVASRPREVGLLFFPRYRPKAATDLIELSKAEAAVELLRHSLNFPNLQSRGFRLTAHITARARSYKLVYGELGEALEQIGNVVSSQGPICEDGVRV